MSLAEPQVEVFCDGPDNCPASEMCSLTPLAQGGYDERYLKSTIESRGWLVQGDSHYCEDCREQQETQ